MPQVDLNLRDSVDLVFHGVFDGNNGFAQHLELMQQRIERGGLAAAGRPRNQAKAAGIVQPLADFLLTFLAEAKIMNPMADSLGIKDAQRKFLTRVAGSERQAQFNQTTAIIK